MVDTEAPELQLLDALYRLNKLVVADARVHVVATAHLDLVDSGTHALFCPGELRSW